MHHLFFIHLTFCLKDYCLFLIFHWLIMILSILLLFVSCVAFTKSRNLHLKYFDSLIVKLNRFMIVFFWMNCLDVTFLTFDLLNECRVFCSITFIMTFSLITSSQMIRIAKSNWFVDLKIIVLKQTISDFSHSIALSMIAMRKWFVIISIDELSSVSSSTFCLNSFRLQTQFHNVKMIFNWHCSLKMFSFNVSFDLFVKFIKWADSSCVVLAL